MTFLNPSLAIVGVACIAIPIIIHILMRRRRRPIQWAAMKFLLAAIRMVETGDWFTPYFHDGSLRFNKPILTYWTIAVPYKLFGINFVTSRIGSLLAGCAILALTYRMGMILLNDRTIALLAVAACIANHHVISMSMRSNPDALLCAVAMLSLTGLAGLVTNPACHAVPPVTTGCRHETIRECPSAPFGPCGEVARYPPMWTVRPRHRRRIPVRAPELRQK